MNSSNYPGISMVSFQAAHGSEASLILSRDRKAAVVKSKTGHHTRLAILFLVAASASFAQTITKVSGDGQLVLQNLPASQPLVVAVKDASGNPLPNVTVTWTLVSGAGGPLPAATVTDEKGQASLTFVTGPVTGGSSYTQSVVQAGIPSGASVNFTITTAGQQGLTILVQASLLFPTLADQPLIGPAGQKFPTPLQVAVSATQGFNFGGVPNVSVEVVTPNPGPTATCAQGIIFTGPDGKATCDIVFGGATGTNQFNVIIGGGFATFAVNFQVVVGSVSTIRVFGGNNQSANINTPLPGPLVGRLEDAGGNAIAGCTVIWESVTAGAVALSNLVTTSDANGRVSATATPAVGGAQQVRVRLVPGSGNCAVPTGTTPPQAVFTVTGIVVPTGLTKLSGDSQIAVINTDFAQVLVVQVNDARGPLPGAPVVFNVASGSASLGSPPAQSVTVTTDAQGRASVLVHAGATAGPVAITATTGTPPSAFSQTFILTVNPPGPLVTSGSFFNAAGGQPISQQGGVAPGTLITIVAPGLAPGIQGTVVPSPLFTAFPFVLANVSLQFGDSFAPVLAVSNMGGTESVIAQVPFGLPPGPIAVKVNVGGGSNTVSINIVPASPGMFQITGPDGVRRALLLRPDGSVVSLQNPARKGEFIRMFITGAGEMNPAVGTNQIGVPAMDPNAQPPAVALPVVVGVNNGGVLVQSATYAPDLVGVEVVVFQVPDDTPSGNNIPLAVAIVVGDQLVFGNPSSIPVM